MTKHNLPDAVKAENARRKRKRIQMKRDAQNREVSAARTAAGLRFMVGRIEVDEQARKLMAFIPTDTRDLTARICGDPLPGRSALDLRHREAAR